jgi:hypothetical protein
VNDTQSKTAGSDDSPKYWCETCEGTSKVYQEHQAGCWVGGDFPCPDCDGKGYWVPRATLPHPATQAGALQAASNLVPGQMHCARCKFQLIRTNLYVNSGTVGAGDSKTEPCPNGCGPLWPVTWEQAAREAWATCETLFERAKAAEDALAAVNPPRLAATRPNAAPAAEVVAQIVTFGGLDGQKEVSWSKGKMPPAGTKLYAAPAAAIDAREQAADFGVWLLGSYKGQTINASTIGRAIAEFHDECDASREEAPAAAGAAQAVARDWTKIEAVIDGYVDDYEMRGETEDGRDACYTPNDNDRALLRDCIAGLLAEPEFVAALAALKGVQPGERGEG